jgi:hypothetical protein
LVELICPFSHLSTVAKPTLVKYAYFADDSLVGLAFAEFQEAEEAVCL